MQSKPCVNQPGGFKKLAGTLEYLAPEVLMQGTYSPASDVYALGITLNEVGWRALFSGGMTYSGWRRT